MRSFLLFLSILSLFCNGLSSEEEEEELLVDIVKQQQCKRPSKSGDVLSVAFMRTSPIDKSGRFDPPAQNKHDFTLGSGEVIQGWEEALVDRCVGDSLVVIVPPHLNKGGKGKGIAINPTESAMFVIDILSVTPKREPAKPYSKSREIFEEFDKDGNNEISRDEVRIFITQTNRGANGLGIPAQGIDHFINGIMQQEDKDRDGVITALEFTGDDHPQHRSHDEL